MNASLGLSEEQIKQAQEFIRYWNSWALTYQEREALQARFISKNDPLTTAERKLREAGFLDNIENLMEWSETLSKLNQDL